MNVAFISGKYSGTPEEIDQNIAHAREAAELLWLNGWAAICPHLNTAHFEGSDVDFYAGYLRMIDRLLPGTDIIYALKNWEDSTGARLEVNRARERGIEVIEEL